MINKFKDIFIGKKKLDQNSSFNFPINEKSLDLNLNEASFLTYHSQVNQSFHSSDIQTMNTDADSQENGVENFNQNFTSILNVPPPKTVH